MDMIKSPKIKGNGKTYCPRVKDEQNEIKKGSKEKKAPKKSIKAGKK